VSAAAQLQTQDFFPLSIGNVTQGYQKVSEHSLAGSLDLHRTIDIRLRTHSHENGCLPESLAAAFGGLEECRNPLDIAVREHSHVNEYFPDQNFAGFLVRQRSLDLLFRGKTFVNYNLAESAHYSHSRHVWIGTRST
jgi:hypothetical protein